MFFHKELFCEKCHAPIGKKEMCIFDYSFQGRNKEGKKIYLCQDCCIKELYDNLRKHSSKAVIIQPSNKYDAFTFYSFEMLSKGIEHSINKKVILKYLKDIESFLPKDGERCSNCGKEANYTWCTMNIYSKNNPSCMDINLQEKENAAFLCTDCLVKSLIQRIKAQKIIFKAIYPMIDNVTGFFTPWLY